MAFNNVGVIEVDNGALHLGEVTNSGSIQVHSGDLHISHLINSGSLDVTGTGRLFLTGDFGGVVNDVISGSNGTDIIDGRSGADRIIGNGGNDILTGGASADTFVFNVPGDRTRHDSRFCFWD